MEIHKTQDGSELAVIAATWEVNRKVSFESLSAEFKRNSAQAWRNYGSRVTGLLVDVAIRDPDAVQQGINVLRSDPWDYRRDRLHEWVRGRRGIRYFFHFDLAKNKDAAGMALTHRERSGVVGVDFMHRVQAKPGKNIDFEGLRGFIYFFQERGFAIEQVSFDQWQSEDSRQILEKKGFKTAYCSADKTTAPYDTTIEMLTTQRLDYYNHPIFLREMKQLRTNGLKYDHPRSGSKDVADAVACATWSCINYELENPAKAPGRIHIHRPSARSPLHLNYGEKSAF